jgi:ABC-type transport system involved in multi-copper enzyme maturation permease subunit
VSSSLRVGVVKTLVRQDLYYALKSARGLLFLVFFGVFWLWLFSKLSSGYAQVLMNPEASVILSMVFDPKVAQSLFVNRAPTLSAFFVLAMSTVPMFVLFAASDQTANDIGSKYLRFLTPRCNRIEIFVGRFIGAVILVAFAYIIVTLIAAAISMSVDKNSVSMVLRDTPLVIVSLVLYTIPFIALMSLCSVVVGSAGLSALAGISVYVIVLVIIAVINFKMPTLADTIAYAIPNGTKSLYLQLNLSSLLTAAISVPIYVLAYGYLGWLIFSKRDI